MAAEPKWCFAWFGEDDRRTQGRSRASAARKYLWAPHAEIFIAWHDDGNPAQDADLRLMVERWAPEWMQFAGLTLTFLDNPDEADIRVSFRFPGCWSTVGTSCRTEKRERPTMNFNAARMRRSSERVQRGIVLHEFGHALGLIHEHQHPLTPMVFDEERIVADVSRPPNNWDEAKIKRNIITPALAEEHTSSAYDPDSIMMYAIPRRWLKSGAASRENHDLSPTDKAFIAQHYPRAA